jgi:hypothetical protein
MPEDMYSVKINRTEGVIEITGADKEWISAELDKLVGVLAAPAPARAARKNEAPAANQQSGAETRPRARRSTDRAELKPALEKLLTSEVKKKLQSYVDARAANWKAQTSQVAIIATFLLDELGWKSIDEDDLYTVYVSMGWPTPGKPRSTLENARGRNGYFGPWSDGKLQLSHKGENFGRAGSMSKS